MRIALERLVPLESIAQALDPRPIAIPIEDHARNADSRIIAGGDHAGKQIQLAVCSTASRWVENAPGLVRIVRIALHNHAKSLHVERLARSVWHWLAPGCSIAALPYHE